VFWFVAKRSVVYSQVLSRVTRLLDGGKWEGAEE
jgi:hypothetical protein